MKGSKRLPRGTEFRTVGELFDEPDRWAIVMRYVDHNGQTHGIDTYTPANLFLDPSSSAQPSSLRQAPSGMVVAVVEIPEDER